VPLTGLPPALQKLLKQLSAAISSEVAEILAARGLHGGAIAVTVVAQPLDAVAALGAEGTHDHRDVTRKVAYAGWRRVEFASVGAKVVVEKAEEERGAAAETSD
jgi:hypothetical protein